MCYILAFFFFWEINDLVLNEAPWAGHVLEVKEYNLAHVICANDIC